MLALDVAFFRPAAEYDDAIDTFLDLVKAAPPADDVDAVLIPGEPEASCRQEREENGVPVDDQTWAQIRQTAAGLNVDI